jgi:hypothetical protein
MAKKGSGPGDEDADFAALDKNSDSIEGILPPLDDSVLHDIFARLDDFSVLDGILSAEDRVLRVRAPRWDAEFHHATHGGKASASKSWPPYLGP